MPKLDESGKLVPSDNNDETKKSLMIHESDDLNKTNEVKDVPSATHPLGPMVDKDTADENKIEEHPPADKSSVGAYNPDTLQYNTRTQFPEAMTRIERVLRDGGMDSMSTMRSLQAIGQILDDVDTDRNKRIK